MKEEYDITLDFVVNSFHCEYHECGSHKLQMIAKIDLEELQELFDSIKKLIK